MYIKGGSLERNEIQKRKSSTIVIRQSFGTAGKKSVRATLWLRPEVISVRRILSTQLGIKQKSLFDFLMEDMKALHSIAKLLVPGRLGKNQRIRKTLVVSHKSLSTLQKVAKQFSVSRDDIYKLPIEFIKRDA